MGSLEAACISGFLCRLCSEMHRTVIHIYGDQGQKHGLAKKINAYLPVTITPNDPLPKTICETCMTRVEAHHELMLKMEKHRSLFATQIARARVIRSEDLVPIIRSSGNILSEASVALSNTLPRAEVNRTAPRTIASVLNNINETIRSTNSNSNLNNVNETDSNNRDKDKRSDSTTINNNSNGNTNTSISNLGHNSSSRGNSDSDLPLDHTAQ